MTRVLLAHDLARRGRHNERTFWSMLIEDLGIPFVDYESTGCKNYEQLKKHCWERRPQPKLGIQNAMWLFLTGERISAGRAVEVGLVHRAVPAAALDRAVEEVAGLVRLGGPNAVREAKQLVRRVPTLSLDEAFRETTATSLALFASEEAAEGMQAFVEKRKPRWAE